jgi:hypothetical protein
MPILDATHYEQIRKAIDIAIDSSILPDSTISMDVYQGEAEEEIIQRVGEYEGLSAAEQAHAVKAAILLTAALIAPNITAIPYYATDGQFTRQPFNGSGRAERLRARADEELAEVEDEEAEPQSVNRPSTSICAKAVW